MTRSNISRHLRRLRARWRLHRMEWEGMHRPLQPPPGFERFHSEEAVLPGLSSKWKKKLTFNEKMDLAKKAWKLYLHSYIHDPEMAEFEKKILDREDMIIKRQVQAFLNRSKENIKRNQEAARDASEQVAQEFQARRPEAEALVKDRVNVLRQALSEFAEGYAEGAEGQLSFFRDSDDDNDYPPDVIVDDNKPVIYKNEKI